MEPRLEEVFKLSGVPTYTFVRPSEYEELRLALRTPGRGLVIEGPSGIGKTTAVRTALSDLSQAHELPYTDLLELSARRPQDVEFISNLHSLGELGMIVVDDFHRLEESVRQKLTDLLKALADSEAQHSKLILIGINRAGDALIRMAPDLNNRIDTIRFEANEADRIAEVLHLGEEALNVTFPSVQAMAEAACGSFYVAQMLGQRACLRSGVTDRQDEPRIVTRSLEAVRSEIFADLNRVFYTPTRAFCRGNRPRPRGRAPYMRLLYWLASEENWLISVPQKLARSPEHRGSIGQIAEKGYIQTLVESNEEISRVLSWDQDSQILSVQDPQYVFFLKNILWSKFPFQIGYRAVSFPPRDGSRYDVALSFAGQDRELSRSIFDAFVSLGMDVFFDENESDRILAESVEDYLAPIYASESSYVVALLSQDYPTKIWTAFESNQFEARFGENSVIPIWFSDSPPQMFDITRGVGGFTFDRGAEIDPQVQRLAEMVAHKIEDRALLEPETTEEASEIDEPPLPESGER